VLYSVYNLCVDLIDGQVAIDCDHTQWLSGGDVAVLGVSAFEEGIFFGFESAFVAAVRGGISRVPAAGAGEGMVEAGKQQAG
jgi:hypothetical protein